ncbi:hypothetical protein L2E82_18298 [Cichorium intybus]|uniref:Uncharacterized protein n=1 Tax=Cichorium intybus TaxID=13427 RepID=A0ACB9F9T1_CICIN|nr:hypothetical protein L2E82_18298 [Cichorium intybus]
MNMVISPHTLQRSHTIGMMFSFSYNLREYNLQLRNKRDVVVLSGKGILHGLLRSPTMAVCLVHRFGSITDLLLFSN